MESAKMPFTYLETKYNFAMLKQWEENEASRVQTLTDKALVAEVALIMSGKSYSWLSISKRLLSIGIIDVFYSRKWNNLCERKAEWDAMAVHVGCVTSNTSLHSFDEAAVILDYLTRSQLWNTKGFRDLLLDLKKVPLHAGLGIEGRSLH